MAGLMQFTYIYLYIYTLLVIYKSSGSLATKVSISQNITGLIGNNDIPLKCSFLNDAQVVRVQFFAKKKTDEFDLTKPIAIFEPDKPAKLLSSGHYLDGRVTLANITSTSTNATLTFHILKCEDEKDYLCQCYYKKEEAFLPPETSPPTRISVQATSSKPNLISSIVVVSITTEMQGFSTSIYNNSLSTTKGDTSPIDTVTTSQSSEKLPLVFREGDTVMFTCSGNIGNPPGKLIWQKIFPQGKTTITYSNETTYIEEIPGQCSFKGTSHLTVKIYAEDIRATIRCFEESQVNAPGMHLETEPLDVHLDDLRSSQESDWWKFVEEHKIPFICGVVGFIVLCAVIVCCICQKKKKNKARCSQKTKSVDITLNTEYATVLRKNNATSGETGDSMLVLNGMDRNKDKSRNKQEDIVKTVDVTTSYHINEYAVPSDALQAGTLTCKIGPGFTSFKDVKDV